MKTIGMILVCVFLVIGFSSRCDGQQPASLRYIEARSIVSQAKNVMARNKIKEELGVLDYQVDALKQSIAAFDETANKIRLKRARLVLELMSDDSLTESEKKNRRAALDKEHFGELAQVAEAARTKIYDSLLPDQVLRLKQIAVQTTLLERAGHDRSSMLLGLIGRLGLSNVETNEYLAKAKEISKAYKKELKALNKKYDQKMLDAMPRKAQLKLQEIIGKPIDD